MRHINNTYLTDPRYSPSRSHLIHAYNLIVRDLLDIFDYVEPANGNVSAYSHELYQLLLRACTEVETNATAILALNGYTSPRRNWNVEDYCKIEKAGRLSEYEVRLSVWHGPGGIFKPFAVWATTHALPWYSDYNAVKHDRAHEFERASLGNVLAAVTGLLVILFAQFNLLAFSRYRPLTMFQEDGGWVSADDSIFEVRVPSSWSGAQQYDFDWVTLKADPSPFQQFSF